jgi:hypothetical protein
MAYFLNVAAQVIRDSLSSQNYEVTNDYCLITVKHKPSQNEEKYMYLVDGSFISKSEYYGEKVAPFCLTTDKLIFVVSVNSNIDITDIEDVLSYRVTEV